MHNIIKQIAEGRWFTEPSPFCCAIEYAHPKVCVITGPNMSGKSLLRKILHARHHDSDMSYLHFSQAGRTSGGIGSCFMYGSEQDDSTGCNSIGTILGAFRTGKGPLDNPRDKPFGMTLDEPEIGCGEELQAALGLKIKREWDTMPQLHGLYIITHSRQVAKQLLPLNPTHWRLSKDGMTLQEWVDRPVVPVESLEELKTMGHDRWCQVEKMLKKT